MGWVDPTLELHPCSECGDLFTITKRELIHVHTERRKGADYSGRNCPGSGKPPRREES